MTEMPGYDVASHATRLRPCRARPRDSAQASHATRLRPCRAPPAPGRAAGAAWASPGPTGKGPEPGPGAVTTRILAGRTGSGSLRLPAGAGGRARARLGAAQGLTEAGPAPQAAAAAAGPAGSPSHGQPRIPSLQRRPPAGPPGPPGPGAYWRQGARAPGRPPGCDDSDPGRAHSAWAGSAPGRGQWQPAVAARGGRWAGPGPARRRQVPERLGARAAHRDWPRRGGRRRLARRTEAAAAAAAAAARLC